LSRTISGSSTVTVASEPAWRVLDQEIAILDLNAEMYYGLGSVGARIWELIQTPIRVDDLRDAIAGEYEVDLATCEADLLALLEQLAARSLIEVTNAKSP
jgi:hypothetical protein